MCKSGGATLSTWSKDIARRFRDKRETQLVRDKKLLQAEETLKRRGPEMWQQLRGLVAWRCAEIKAEPGLKNALSFNSSGTETFLVTRNDSQKTFRGTFNPKNHCVEFSSSKCSPSQFKLEIQGMDGTSDVLFVDEKRQPLGDTESFVNDHLESLLEMD